MHYLNDHRFLSWVLGLVAGGALLSVPLCRFVRVSRAA